MTTPSLFTPSVFVIEIPGAPRTKKNSPRILRFGKRNKLAPSEAWIEWRDFVHYQLRLRGIPRPNIGYPCFCSALFYRHADVGDSHGYYNGLADVLEDCGIVRDDKLIRHWDGSRMLRDPKNPRTLVTLTAL